MGFGSALPLDSADADITFAFGPNGTYFFETPNGRNRKNLPTGLTKLLHSEPAHDIRTLGFSFTSNGGYTLLYRDGMDNDIRELYARDATDTPTRSTWIKKYIDDKTTNSRKTAGKSTRRINFSTGPKHAGTFFVFDGNTCRWSNVPVKLDVILQFFAARMPEAGEQFSPPMHVTFGVEGTFILLYEDGSWVTSHHLKDYYPEAAARLERSRCKGMDLSYVALNPYSAGEFFFLYTDGSADWKVPAAYKEEVDWLALGLLQKPAGRYNSSKLKASDSTGGYINDNMNVVPCPA